MGIPVGGYGHPCGWVCPGLSVPGEEHPSGPADGPSLQCSFLPKFSIYIETKYEDNCGDSENVSPCQSSSSPWRWGGHTTPAASTSHPPSPPQIFHSEKILGDHEVSFLDIAFDEIPERYYRSLEVAGLGLLGSSLGPLCPLWGREVLTAPLPPPLQDPRFFSSAKTGRGPLREGWRQHTKPIMCSYKLVSVKFEVWGLQTRVEQFVHKVRGWTGAGGLGRDRLLTSPSPPRHVAKVIRDILLIGHRQAFAWVDEWCGESLWGGTDTEPGVALDPEK